MWVIVEENYAGLYVVSSSGCEDVFYDLGEAHEFRDEREVAAVEAGYPAGFTVYELRKVD